MPKKKQANSEPTNHAKVLKQHSIGYQSPPPSPISPDKPITLSDDTIQIIIDRLFQGEYLSAIINNLGLSPQRTFEYISNDPRLSELRTRANVYRSDIYLNRALQTLDQLRLGEIDPKSAKVMIEHYQWIASRLDPQYADYKAHHAFKGDNNITIQVAVTHDKQDQFKDISQTNKPKLT